MYSKTPSIKSIYVHKLDKKSNWGSVAVLVHEDCKNDQSICLRVELQPIPVVLHVAYLNEPQRNVIMKHCNLVQQIMLLECSIVVLEDFTLLYIVKYLDETEIFCLQQNIASHAEFVKMFSHNSRINGLIWLKLIFELSLFSAFNEKFIKIGYTVLNIPCSHAFGHIFGQKTLTFSQANFTSCIIF